MADLSIVDKGTMSQTEARKNSLGVNLLAWDAAVPCASWKLAQVHWRISTPEPDLIQK
ncbi:MAG: hypothetical protein AAF409_19395 [Pseudomonadota bacterium]